MIETNNLDRFKLRAWHKEEKMYLQEDSEAFVSIGCDGDILAREYLIVDDERVLTKDLSIDDFVLEQCTGKKDESETLIYENDKIDMIVFYFDGEGESEQEFSGYVMWNNGEFVISQNPNVPEYDTNITDTIPHLSWGHSFKIIGNIHDEEKI